MVVCLLLKADMPVSLRSVSVLNQQHQPFQHIPYKEGYIQQLLLLLRMNQFMIHFLCIQRPNREDKAKQTYSQIVSTPGMPFD